MRGGGNAAAIRLGDRITQKEGLTPDGPLQKRLLRVGEAAGGPLQKRLLRVGEAAGLCACPDGRRVDRGNPRAAHAASKGTYRAPRLQFDLAEAGIRVSRKRVARLMLNAGLVGVSRRKSAVTTVRDGARQAPDLVDRNFTVDQPNRRWVADIT